MSHDNTYVGLSYSQADSSGIRLLQEIVRKHSLHKVRLLEEMAAAYFLKTGIDPEEVELVEERKVNKTIWYFRRRRTHS